jgi:hypothetical protein
MPFALDGTEGETIIEGYNVQSVSACVGKGAA